LYLRPEPQGHEALRAILTPSDVREREP